MDEKKLVLEIKYGGLGDHLFYSHIPRIAKETGMYDKVYLSSSSEFRHLDYRKLVWDLNPYFDGMIDEKGLSVEKISVDETKNLLDEIMLGLGIDDGKRFHEPEIYYSPKKEYIDLKDLTIYDPNFVSYVGDFTKADLRHFITEKNIKINRQMRLRGSKHMDIDMREALETESLEDFCDMLISVREIYCLASGTATLAAALGKPAKVFYGKGQSTIFHHSKTNIYILVPQRLLSKIFFINHSLLRRIKILLKKILIK